MVLTGKKMKDVVGLDIRSDMRSEFDYILEKWCLIL